MADAKPKTEAAPGPWEALRAPFPVEDIELLPRAIGDKDKRHKEKCAECGGFHDFPCVHLSYIGHAGITTRLNEVDPAWTWEPMARTPEGMPVFDQYGGLWGWMTVLGVTKPCYGDPGLNFKNEPKRSCDGQKEAIGDLIRNGAMRFGVGTYLWSKSDRAKAALVGADDPEPAPAGRTRGANSATSTTAPTATTPTDGHDITADPGSITKRDAAKLLEAAKALGKDRAFIIANARKNLKRDITTLDDLSSAEAQAMTAALEAAAVPAETPPDAEGAKELAAAEEIPF